MLDVQSLTIRRDNSVLIEKVSFQIPRGRITGLISLNTLETSMLADALYGTVADYHGAILMDKVSLPRHIDQRTHSEIFLVKGTQTVFYNLSILDNLFLTREVKRSRQHIVPRLDEILRPCRELFDALNFRHNLYGPAGALSPEEMQKLSLIQGFSRGASLTIFENVTRDLRLDTTRAFFDLLRKGKEEGRSFILIPDNPNQVFEVCDEVIVLRNGRAVFHRQAEEVDIEELYNILNNTEYNIFQAIENKFHQFVLNIDNVGPFLERSLKLLGNFCGIYDALAIFQDEEGTIWAHSKYWDASLEPLSSQQAKAILANYEAIRHEAEEPSVRWQNQEWRIHPMEAAPGALALVLLKEPFETTFPFNHLMGLMFSSLRELYNKIQRRRQEKQREIESIRMESELDIARRIQQSILPRSTELRGYEIAAHMITATEVGGDIFEIYPTPIGNFIGVGDVSGHGLSSGLTAMLEMAALHGTIQTHLTYDIQPVPSKIYDIVNFVLCLLNRDRIGSDKFMTKVLMIEKDGQFMYAGTHEIGLLFRARENRVIQIENMINRTCFLGLNERLDSSTSLGTFTMESGDILLLYTDGLIEARNQRDEQYDLSRAVAFLDRNHHMNPKEFIKALIQDVYNWAKEGDIKRNNGRLADDMTIMVVRKK